MHQYYQPRLLKVDDERRTLTQASSNLTNTVQVSGELTQNCHIAFNVVDDCYKNPTRCSFLRTVTKLTALEHQRQKLESRMHELTRELDELTARKLLHPDDPPHTTQKSTIRNRL